MQNKEIDLIIEALETLKSEIFINDYSKPHSSMNIEEKAYAEEKMNNINILIKYLKGEIKHGN